MEVNQGRIDFFDSNSSDDSSSPLNIDEDENINVVINNIVNKQYELSSSIISPIDYSDVSSNEKYIISDETTTISPLFLENNSSLLLNKSEGQSVLPLEISIPDDLISLENIPKSKKNSPLEVNVSKETFQATPTHQSARQSRDINRESNNHKGESSPKESNNHKGETSPRESIPRESRQKPQQQQQQQQQQQDLNLRKGKWTIEEENYANEIILLFNKGLLPILPGTTLRSYLSDKLSCDPMRITKKYSGASCIGKQVFQACVLTEQNIESMKGYESKVDVLERIFLDRLGSKSKFVVRNQYNFDENSNKNSSFDSISNLVNTTKNVKNNSKLKRTVSAPDLSSLSINSLSRTNSSTDLSNSKPFAYEQREESPRGLNKRPQSMMDLLSFEDYIKDDEAAGELLLLVADTIHRTHSSPNLAPSVNTPKGSKSRKVKTGETIINHNYEDNHNMIFNFPIANPINAEIDSSSSSSCSSPVPVNTTSYDIAQIVDDKLIQNIENIIKEENMSCYMDEEKINVPFHTKNLEIVTQQHFVYSPHNAPTIEEDDAFSTDSVLLNVSI